MAQARPTPKLLAAFLAVALAAPWALPASAWGDDEQPIGETSSLGSDPTAGLDGEVSELTAEIERTGAALDEANARVAEVEQRIADNEEQLSSLYNQIPTQLQRSSDAVRELYKMQYQSSSLIELLLNADNFADFIVNFQYVTHIQQRHLDTVEKLRQMKEQLDATQSALAEDRAAALAEQENAKAALASAQQAREEAQRRAREEAERQAREAAERRAAEEAAAKEAAEAEAARLQAEREKAEAGQTPDAPQGEEVGGPTASPDPEPAPSVPQEPENQPTDDGIDYGNTDKTQFVASWAPRIDAFLAGSPMAGTGTIFAEAAWDYGVDPRWSPAIANTESSRGVICFLPFNAWGWGSASWGSWDEAIRAHVSGLAAGYGYTISEWAAQKYCPPNWQAWYDRTVAAMNSI